MADLSGLRATPLSTSLPIAGATLAAAPAAARFILRGTAAVEAAGLAFGIAIPIAPLSSAQAAEHVALWLGPDEWLLLAPASETKALQQALTDALRDIPSAIVDISHRQTALLLEGEKAATILNAGVPLDLSVAAFPVGMVVRTIFEKVEIVLWRTGPQAFRVEVWRSFAPYVLALLQEAARSAP